MATLDIARFVEGNDAREAGVQMLHETLDRSALARGIAALEQDDKFLPAILSPFLHLKQFGLQLGLVRFIDPARHRRFIGIIIALCRAIIGQRCNHGEVLDVRSQIISGIASNDGFCSSICGSGGGIFIGGADVDRRAAAADGGGLISHIGSFDSR